MRIAITTGGSRGDVQPVLALALGLSGAGHEVKVVAQESHEGFVRRRGVDFSAVAGSPEAEIRDVLSADLSPFRFAKLYVDVLEKHMRRHLAEYLGACCGAEAIVHTPGGFLGYEAARLLGVASVGAGLQPLISRTRSFRSSIVPAPPGWLRRTGGEELYNYSSHVFAEQLFWQLMRKSVNKALTRHAGMDFTFLWPISIYAQGKEPRGSRLESHGPPARARLG